VLKNCGPRGYPGMAEVGNMGLPPKLLAQGVTDMVRISDARMSGTAYGTVVLHVAPEARAGGPLAVVREGDWIELDAETGRLHLDVPEKPNWPTASPPGPPRSSPIPPTAPAIASCTSSTCCRPTRAATSISSSARAEPACLFQDRDRGRRQQVARADPPGRRRHRRPVGRRGSHHAAADLEAGATGAMTGGGYPGRHPPDHGGAPRAAIREGAARAYERWLPLINYENRQGGILTAKALMKAGGIIACEAPRHPFPAMHPEGRKGLLDIARRLDPLVLRWGR
jgi:hypothetical protein